MLTLLEQHIQLILNNTEMVKQQITNMSRYWWVKKTHLEPYHIQINRQIPVCTTLN